MGVLTMGSQSNEKQSLLQPLARQNSIYSLTLDEVENQLGELGKPLSSMNLDELLKNVWTTAQSDIAAANQPALQRQGSLPLTGALSKKTVDEVWRDIQQGKSNEEMKYRERQPTLGEMTLEDFLVKAGVVAENKCTEMVAAQQGQWMQYSQPRYQHPHPPQNMMGVYVGPSPVIDVSYPESQVALPSPSMGTLSDTQTPGRKRAASEDVVEKTVERRQKRMIKNRESAARSRARKQAYTNELENKVSCLEEENERLRKRKEVEKMLPSGPPPEPKYQLRRTTSAPL